MISTFAGTITGSPAFLAGLKRRGPDGFESVPIEPGIKPAEQTHAANSSFFIDLHAHQRIHLELVSFIERSEPLHLSRNKVVTLINRFLGIHQGIVFTLISAHNRRHLYQARRMTGGRAPEAG